MLRLSPALTIALWPGRLVLPALGDLPLGRTELALLAAYAGGTHPTHGSAARAVTGRADDAAALTFSRRLRFTRQLALVPRTAAGAAPIASAVAPPPQVAPTAPPDPTTAAAQRLATPLSIGCTSSGFVVLGHDGHLLLALALDDLLALADLADAPPDVQARSPWWAHLVAAGLTVPTATGAAARCSPAEIEARVREAFSRAAAEVAAGPAGRGAPRVDVVPVSYTMGPPLALGMIFASIAAHDGGRLLERYRLRPDWVGVEDRIEAYARQPLVILASAYVWSHVAVLEVARRAKAVDPRTLVVVGGPDVPSRESETRRYLQDHPEVDVVVHGEGEEATVAVLDALAVRAGGGFDLHPLRDVPGLTVRLPDEVVRTPDRPRIEDLDALPSPFLEGWFDTYRDAPFDRVILETNRGCPYGCTFCDWGSATMSRIRQFSLDRVLAEVAWAVDAGCEGISFADANFGIFARDVQIAEALAEHRRRTGRPRSFGANFAKNTVKHLREIIRILVDAGIVNRGLLALQTTDAPTLDVIARSNIPVAKYEAVAVEMRAAGLPFAVELMMGLPGSTVASFKADLQQCIDHEVEGTVNPTSVLVNSPMNAPAYRAAHGIVTTDQRVGANALVVATETFSRDDYEHMRALRRTFLLGENFGVTRHVDRLVRHVTGITEIDILERLHADVITDPAGALEHPFLHQLFGQRSPILVVPVSWGLLIDDLVAYVAATYPSVPASALATAAAVQHAHLPANDRRYPQVIDLEHDYATWFSMVVAAKEAGHGDDWPDRVPALADLEPASLVVDDPDRRARDQLGCSVDHGPLLASWEHASLVARPLFVRTASI